MELADRGAQVFFLDPPDQTRCGQEFRIKDEVAPGIREVLHQAPLRGLRFLPSILRKPLMKRQVRRLEKACGVESFDVVWSFEGSRFFHLSLFGPESLKIFHMVDLVQNQNLSKVGASADLVFSTTSFIEEELSPYAVRVQRIPHGYRPGGSVVEEGLRKGDGVQVGYLGNLSIPFLDRELMTKLPQCFPEACFHFFGPTDEEDPFLKELKGRSNVLQHGPIPRERIAPCLSEIDVLLVLYDAEAYRKQVAAPHKMMDYLASGKVIVATWMEEHREHRDLIRMVERQEDLIPALKEVVENLETWNAPELQKRRKAIAESRTYDKLLDRILEKAHEAKPSFFE